MKFSIIIPFRDRFSHLGITVPRIREVLQDVDHEIIIVEQNDKKKFRRANLLNEGARIATGDLLAFHDVDYYPDTVQYYDFNNPTDVFLPVNRVTFVYNDLATKPLDQVPKGYRHFCDGVDIDFFGGVEVFRRDAFFKINGFSPDFIGWGFEDADLRERIFAYNLSVARASNNHFLALDHIDSGPAMTDMDFRGNAMKLETWRNNLSRGINNCHPATISIDTDMQHLHNVDKWVKATGFDMPIQTHIVSSTFNFDEGDE